MDYDSFTSAPAQMLLVQAAGGRQSVIRRQYVKACTMAAWLPAKCSSQALQRLVRASTPLRADYVHGMNVPGARRGKSLQNTEPHHPEHKGYSQIEDVAQCSTPNISIGSATKDMRTPYEVLRVGRSASSLDVKVCLLPLLLSVPL